VGFSGFERWEAQGLGVLPSVWVQKVVLPEHGLEKVTVCLSL
jgi:hypothetical protein